MPIAKDSSGAESMLRAYPAEDRSPVAQVIRELAALAMKDQLWVKDFREFGKIIDETNFCGSDALVPLVFGKPDAENVRTGQRRMSPTNLIVDCNLRDLLYYQRVLNPTTGKNENLTICFVDGFFYKAVAESGNHYSR